MLWESRTRVTKKKKSCWNLQPVKYAWHQAPQKVHSKCQMKCMKPGYLQQKSTGFRGGKQKHSQQHTWNIHSYRALRTKLDTTVLNFKGKSKGMDQRSRDPFRSKKFIISNDSLFHSSNSYINLGRLLELVRLTWLLCWRFQRPTQWEAEPGTTSCRNLTLNARRAWWEEDAGEICQRGIEKIYLAWELKTTLSPLTALCCCLNLKMNRCWEAPGGFGANVGKCQGTDTQTHMHAQCSSEYSLILRYML